MTADVQTVHSLVLEDTAGLEQEYIYQATAATLLAPTLKIYHYTEPAVILGRSQRPDEGQVLRAAQQDLPLITRKSGGGAVMVGPEMVSVTALFPPEHAVGKRNTVAAYNWMGLLWQKVLKEHGIASQLPAPEAARSSQRLAKQNGTAWACYSSVSHGELLSIDGRKLLGLAQIRTRFCTALTSGIYMSQPDWSLLSKVIVNDESPAALLQAGNASLVELGYAGDASAIAANIERMFQQKLVDESAS